MDFEEFFENNRSRKNHKRKSHHTHDSDFHAFQKNKNSVSQFDKQALFTLLKRNKKYRYIVILIAVLIIIVFSAVLIVFWPWITELAASIWNQGGKELLNESKNVLKQ